MKGFEFAGPTFNAVVSSAQAGDFLGMGAVGERLYGRVFPGLNNTVRHIRAYSALCWAVDHAVRQASSDGEKVNVAELASATTILLDKVQLLLTWQAWREQEKMVPGLSAFKDDRDKRDLTLDGWGVKTTFMNPLYYLPGLVNGIGLLGRGIKEAKGTFSCTPAGTLLAKAFAKELESLEPAVLRWLKSTDDITCTRKRLSSLSEVISLRKPSKSEKTNFLHLYLDGSVDLDGSSDPTRTHRIKNARKRKQSIVLALRALEAIEAGQGKTRDFVPVESIRQVMAAGYAPERVRVDLNGVEESWREWYVLQIRQLQRLGMEALLGLVERVILRKEQAKEPTFKADICRELQILICETEAPGIALGATIGSDLEWYRREQKSFPSLQAAGICRARHKEFLNTGAMKDYLRGFPIVLQPNDIEGTFERWATTGQFAINALTYCAIEIENLRALVHDEKKARDHVESLLAFDDDKLCLAQLAALVNEYRDRPLGDFVFVVISRYVIEQHLSTAGARTASAGDGKNRFIFTQESHGLSRWREGRAAKFIFAQEAHDILLNALLLLEDCGCLDVRLGAGPQGRYYRDASFRLLPAGRRLLADASQS
ncbi:hypothetical protein [Massilia endophytica]|uniref:hypothetical protein n=1 Tax=Massilia endophytica TaxID=2899220 RepID=UPI001E2A581B|nr:hypothetical protein [Massilia endophytica]UGQ46385.1 hypothetical protein LSQ66_21895 [Massilia endophytica]